MLFAAIFIMSIIYKVFLRGRFADAAVGFLSKVVFSGDYDTAYRVYQVIFRNNMELFLMAAALVLFLIVLRVYSNSVTRYFDEINRGIDALIEENTGDIILPSELASTEVKINSIKHTLEQRKLAAELAEQRKNDLVVYLAHDLKTPLTSVIGYLTLLRDEKQISEELREKYLSISLDKAERLEDLINEFFEITRFNLTNITLEYSRINLTLLLEQLTYEFGPMLSEKNLICSLEIPQNLMLKCDADKMQRVFDNLLRNAVNYSFADSTIRIAAMQKESCLSIRITNRGNTIPQEKLARIFEQFYRLDNARGSRSGGAGLGLAIAKEIVELHGGTITARSENEMIEFEVILPL
ncbi:MAG: HAMP domain-containing sensor histidine kinase [Lachnospiraceae bacterium]|nr:HAMP domain-containing sensor histidine kinase [Lachnospiraceae bacterium]